MSSGRRKSDSVDPKDVPKAVVSRLSLYLRELHHLIAAGHATTSSGRLGQQLGFSDAQVRRDLAYFGHFGQPGVGYRCDELIGAIRGILGTDREWRVAMVGVGNLGQALLGYRGFASQGFKIVAAFDVDQSKTNRQLGGVPVFALDDLAQVVQDQRIELGLVAVPASTAQLAADRLVAAGVAGILNFAPVTLNLPDHVSHVGVDLATELEQLCFSVANRSSGT
ncbi:redox-sensing transcriptional repressor Rex [Aeoliella sp. ICT_H6.2]|uniref:Redox-sensing transcriptional repressor Rex n=1 Tax=Aeoliella straminimaris TaxID=2954799 RepID=A0A9X2FF65_9BACT|nr:redox-sensing transcriptional repressor Rex [Aeoliella straminimaris]MCO6047960.1 redox-sensing transcriptional repressor Rex [Aeoliella straminimaris]